VNVPIVFVLGLMAAAVAFESITTERAKETRNGLIATPLSGFEILRSKLLACLWWLRSLLYTLLGLGTIGLATRAVHSLGYLLTVLELVASAWFCMSVGLLAPLRSRSPAGPGSAMLNLLGPPVGSIALPNLLPARRLDVSLDEKLDWASSSTR
jgi:hypothetical protein